MAFESCPGAGDSTRARILWKMKLKLKKNSLVQIFTGENKKKTKQTNRIFHLFRGLFCFFNRIFPGLWVNFFHTYLTKNLRSCPWLVCLKFSLGYGYPHPLLCIKSHDHVKQFVRVLVLLVINTGCLKKFQKKMGNTTLLISSSFYAKRHINVCSGGPICVPRFFPIFRKHPV